MYFHGDKGRQILDLRNDFIITFDKQLVTAKSKKVAPDRVSNATYIIMGQTSRLKATIKVLAFIWSKHLLTFKVKTMADGKTTESAATINTLCNLLGHKMRLDTVDVAGSSTCHRCGHKEEGIEWPRATEEG